MSNVTIQAKKRSDRTKVTEVKASEDGSIHVRSFGTGSQSRNRFLDIASGTREKVEWPAGANITELTFYATLSTAQITAGTEGVYVRVAIDAANDTAANSMLTRASSATDDAQWIPVPIGQVVSIPLTSALSNGSLGGGRVDVLTDEGQALDVWIGAN